MEITLRFLAGGALLIFFLETISHLNKGKGLIAIFNGILASIAFTIIALFLCFSGIGIWYLAVFAITGVWGF